MADNAQLPATGVGTADLIVATDDVGGVQYQRVKLVDPTPDSTTGHGILANPIRVDPTGTTTQPVSGTVAISNPTANPETGLAKDVTLGAVNETAPASDTASSGLNGRLQRLAQRLTSLIALLPASLGQKAKAASLAVTLASDQDALPVTDAGLSLTVDGTVAISNFPATQPVSGSVAISNPTTNPETGLSKDATLSTTNTEIGAVNETAPASDTASSGLSGRLQRIAQRLTSLIALLPTALGAGGGLKVDGSGTALPVSGTVTANPTRPATGTSTNVASNTSNVTILAANAGRYGATVFNDSTQVLYLKLGATASATSHTVQMAAGGYYEVPFGYTGVLEGLWAASNGNARVTEVTA